MLTGEETLEKLVCETTVEIKNAEGLHMRPAMKFVDLASRFPCDITVSNDEMKADAKSIMDLLTLGAVPGAQVTVSADGKDAQEALETIANLVDRNFEEEGE